MTELEPIGDRIKVLPLRPPSKTAGGILLPATSEARERPQLGLVLACGGAVTEINARDVVAFGRYAGVAVTDGEQDVLLMRESEVLGIKPHYKLAEEEDEWVGHGGDEPHLVGDPRCPACRDADVA
jgi:co-chaperonin GroES (HSP10)